MRFYVALGLAKGWKSSFLLNAALWALKYNKLTPQNPKMKPVVVYLTQENSVKETIKRIWGYAFGNDSVISDYEPGVAARMLEEAGIFTPNQPNKPELVIWYRSSKSISTADLNNMLDELNKEGKECVFLIQDYLKRIRPTVPEKEVRLELARVSDEFASMAKERNIPILSAMQLNRDAFRTFDQAESMEGQVASVDKLGASNVGESIDIIQNCDGAFILGLTKKMMINDYDVEEIDSKYLIFKLVAYRGRAPKYTTFQHRFATGNDLRLIEDINMPTPVSAISTSERLKNEASSGTVRTKGKRTIV